MIETPFPKAPEANYYVELQLTGTVLRQSNVNIYK